MTILNSIDVDLAVDILL